MLQFEQDAWAKGLQRLAGVDEAGRGPWAGPVVAAAVIFDPAFVTREQNGLLKGLTDSKKLTARSRERFFEILTASASVEVGVGRADPEEIDRLNILRATHQAMARALLALTPLPAHALVDGGRVHGLPCPSTSIIRGDSLSLSVAAASVAAKVTRDRIMQELSGRFPLYGFERHKGYGTADHRAALRKYGPCPVHRRSFRPVKACLAGPGPVPAELLP